MKPRGLERALLFIVAGAFVLSLLIGLLSNKPFGIALGRAFLSSILFGAIIAGGVLLLRRFIPDLGSLVELNRKSGEPEAGEAEVGRVVDYTVGEGIPGGLQDGEAYAAAASLSPEIGDIGGDHGELGLLSAIPEPGDLSGVKGRASSYQRAPLASAGQSKPGAQGGVDHGVVASGVTGGRPGAGPEGGEVIDEALPSLDTLFESDEEEAGPAEAGVLGERREERKRMGGKGDYINIGDARIPNEPGVMAKAIKRVMKQD
jgi:hypothetical protein